ncbi:capsule polysacchride export protein KpsS [Catenovulum agarivorans DS-2]|uniref:Capsule polysacchride export protein KpsS n=1 Tax=Catenovulum agarivorans DS-2 TaxID=1328313 RepID=W7QBR4_9ALTE|nr:capsular biosynthesis protein [Catenovulum agarivorans]EWH10284.1 capsule polysacchride export protein KpsS [Catenovulum agarivorans DS-2]
MSNILFLQGPLGPFFGKLAKHLSKLGNTTYKINFNGGDAIFSNADHVFNYRGSLKSWQRYLSMFVRRNNIHAIVVYGDCRSYHSIAKEICNTFNIEFWAFEEGYVRPNHITLEKGGVNANSPLNISTVAHAQATLAQTHELARIPEHSFGQTFFHRLFYGVSYYCARGMSRIWLYNDGHHREYTNLDELRYWAFSIYRKWKYKLLQSNLDKWIVDNWANQYFFVPLQVHCDSQIHSHSDYQDVKEFIRRVMVSFAKHAPKDKKLVFKHHPMDRGFRHYGKLIRRIAAKLDIQQRVVYGHELHLPTMLKNCCGTVTINSTVGLSSLHHSKPTKVMGRANYNVEGLTSQYPLNFFWESPCPPNPRFFAKFKQALKAHTQINGSFYRDIDLTCQNIVEFLTNKQVKVADYKQLNLRDGAEGPHFLDDFDEFESING